MPAKDAGVAELREDCRTPAGAARRALECDRENPDLSLPPDTDSGTMPNLKFSYSDTHRRLELGGWSREVTVRELPIATTLAGVNMRLTAGGVRELHWHKEAEWAYVLDGRVRVTAIDADGHGFVDDVASGDLWYFPSAIPHSLQALAEGAEFCTSGWRSPRRRCCAPTSTSTSGCCAHCTPTSARSSNSPEAPHRLRLPPARPRPAAGRAAVLSPVG